MNKIAKVIASSFSSNREVRVGATYPDHNQEIRSVIDYEDMLRYIFDCEVQIEAGYPTDTVLVINGDLPTRTRNLLKLFDGKKTKNGEFKVFFRENIGGSFGAYAFAFKELKHNWFLFTEDDIIITGENYCKDLMECFNSRDNIGFVGVVGKSTSSAYPIHCHGGVGLTRRAILLEVAAFNGGDLPYPKGTWDKQRAITEGEVPFTNLISRLGYELVSYNNGSWSPKNHVMPYFDVRVNKQWPTMSI